jgi:hypothetical protein
MTANMSKEDLIIRKMAINLTAERLYYCDREIITRSFRMG